MDSYELFTIQMFIIVFGLLIGWILSGPHLARSSLSPYDLPIKYKKEKQHRRDKINCTCKYCGKKYIPLCQNRICNKCKAQRKIAREQENNPLRITEKTKEKEE